MSKSPDNNDSPKRPKKKRRWAKILGVLLLLFAGLVLLVNGPIGRWFVGKTIREKLAEQGLTGDLKVEGRLHSGLTLRDARFTGSGDIEFISFDEIGVRYWILDLLDKKVERISIRNLVATVTLHEKPKPEEKEPFELPDLQKIGDAIRKIRPLVLPIEIDIEGIDLTAKRPEKESLMVKLGSLNHAPGADTITIGQLRSNALGEDGLPTQDLVLTWENERIALGRTEVLPELAVDFLSIALPVGGTASVETMVDALASELRVQADESGKVHLELADKPLDLSKLTYLPDLELQGTVETLVVDLEHMLSPMGEWRGTVDLAANGLVWPKGELANVKVGCVLGEDISVTIDASGDLHLEATARHPAEKSDDPKTWLEDLVIAFDLTAPSLHNALQNLIPAAGKAVPELAKIPEGALGAKGEVTLGGEKVVSAAKAEWSFSQIVYQENSIPNLTGTASLENDSARATVTLAQPRPEETLEVGGEFKLEAKSYTATLKAALPDPAWFLPFLPKQEDPLWKPTGPLALEWSGNGELGEKPLHKGTLDLTTLTVTAPEDTRTDLALKANYAWPGMVEASELSLRNGGLSLEGALKWNEDRLTITELGFKDETGPLTTLKGSAPLKLDTLKPADYLQQEEKLDLALEGSGLKLGRIAKLLPLKLPEGADATLSYNLQIGGSPALPTLAGEFSATAIATPTPENLPPLEAAFVFSTADRTLTVNGTVSEPDGQLVELAATYPLQLKKCIDDPEEFGKLELVADATVRNFALQRLQRFVPQLAEAEGAVVADVHVKGPVREPQLSGSAAITLDRYPLPNTPYREVRDSRVDLQLDGQRITIGPASVFNCAGGRILPSGSVGLVDTKPDFALQLVFDHAPVWRNDLVILRSNGLLKIEGPLESARLTGQLEIVESIFHKDVELIPYGLPAESVPKVSLPKIDVEDRAAAATLPEPFANWGVDLTIRTGDPLLIRGNLATGQITCDTRIEGTLGKPRPSGSVNIVDTEAVLPFSRLAVKNGTISLRPDAPFDPRLDIKGTSKLGDYELSMRLSGTASDPRFEVFSTPPLPESEILTLLATGTTSEGLGDPSTAALKAAQLFITDLRKRATRPGGNARFLRILDGLDAVDLDFGDTDRFTGRTFYSASMRVSKSDHWYFSAGVDREGHTRGLVTFKFRLRDFAKKLPELADEKKPKPRRDVTRIRIRGLRIMPEEKAVELLAGRLEFARQRPASASRADDAAYLLEQLLIQKGFAGPDVEWTLPGPNTIVLTVSEGPRYQLGRINPQGAGPEETREIGAIFRATHLGETPDRKLLARSGDIEVPYLSSRNEAALRKAEELYISKGYRAARVTISSIRKGPAGGKVDLNLKVRPGSIFKLAPVIIDSNYEDVATIRLRVSKVNGRDATTGKIKTARSTVERFYRERGFTHAKIQMFAEERGNLLQLRFRITEGTKYTVGEVRVEGNEITHTERITNRFKEFPGTTYDPEAFRGEISELFGTGAFQGMQLEESPQADGTIDFLLRVREAEPDGYFSYLGAGSFEGPFVGGGYFHRNLFGKLWHLSTGFELSALGLLGDVRVTDPWFLGYDLRFTPRAFLVTRKFEGYSKFEGGFGAELSWDVNEHWSMAVDGLWSYVTLNNAFVPSLPSAALGTSDYLLQTIGVRSTWDYRNKKALPTDGHFIELKTEAGLVVGKEAISFLRSEAHVSFYEPVIKDVSNVAIGARAGVIIPTSSDNDLPVDLRYFLGGADTVRSFPARELGPEAVNGIPRGGEAYWIANAEYIHKIAGPLKAVVFVDAGALSRDHGTLFQEDIKFAAGIGLRLNLPVGPVRLEYGHGFFNDPSDPDGAFHFAIGVTF